MKGMEIRESRESKRDGYSRRTRGVSESALPRPRCKHPMGKAFLDLERSCDLIRSIYAPLERYPDLINVYIWLVMLNHSLGGRLVARVSACKYIMARLIYNEERQYTVH